MITYIYTHINRSKTATPLPDAADASTLHKRIVELDDACRCIELKNPRKRIIHLPTSIPHPTPSTHTGAGRGRDTADGDRPVRRAGEGVESGGQAPAGGGGVTDAG